MAELQHGELQDSDLPPPGRRWGAGAQSVLPYLTRSLQGKPVAADPVDAHPSEVEARPSASQHAA